MFLRRATLNNKVNNTVPWIYVISDLNDKESFSTFYKKGCREPELTIKKVIKRKGDRMYFK